jgi:hypothetical protein
MGNWATLDTSSHGVSSWAGLINGYAYGSRVLPRCSMADWWKRVTGSGAGCNVARNHHSWRVVLAALGSEPVCDM